jgi:hypothetical protein
MKYKAEDLQRAMTAVKGGLSLRKAEVEFGIPRSTISDRVMGKYEDGCTPGRPPVIPPKVEDDLVQKSMSAYQNGLGLSRHQLMVKAGQVCKTLKIRTPFKNGIAGKDWFNGLKHRHPEVALRKPAKLSTARSRLTDETTRAYFLELGSVLDTNNIQNPSHIWNMDETGMSLEHTPQAVVAMRGARHIPGRVSTYRDNVTVVACVNASGQRIPPLFIVKGKTHKSLQSYGTHDGPAQSVWTYQSNAWMEDVLGQQWFEKVFLKHCGASRPQLLILDQHKSHEVTGLLERAVQENIIIMALPPHSSHWLQPLDKGVFGPLKSKYNTVCSQYTSENHATVSKCVFPKLFNEAYEQAVTPANIKSGFRTTGIYPYNPTAVPAVAYAPSILSMEETSEPMVTHAPMSTAGSPSTTEVVATISPVVSVEPSVESCSDVDTFRDILLASGEEISPSTESPAIYDLPVPPMGSCINLQIQPPLTQSMSLPLTQLANSDPFLTSPIDWNADCNAIFDAYRRPPTPPPTQELPPQASRKLPLSGHRLLTSADVIAIKKDQALEKEKKKKLAEERKKKREAKQQAALLDLATETH